MTNRIKIINIHKNLLIQINIQLKNQSISNQDLKMMITKDKVKIFKFSKTVQIIKNC